MKRADPESLLRIVYPEQIFTAAPLNAVDGIGNCLPGYPKLRCQLFLCQPQGCSFVFQLLPNFHETASFMVCQLYREREFLYTP